MPLKNLDASNNALTSLPSPLPHKTLELLDVSGNKLASLEVLNGCSNLVTLSVDDNALDSLDALPFAGLGKRLVTLSACSNQIASVPWVCSSLMSVFLFWWW